MNGVAVTAEDPETPDEPGVVDLRMDQPTPARMYDYYLGGKDNFKVDRDAAEAVLAASGRTVATAAWENRRFLQRAVSFLVAAGIDQFIDIGAGLPTQGNVHEIAQRANPGAHVVYVDNDPIVLAYGRALLATNDSTRVITADMRRPEVILAHPDVEALIDFSRPIAVLFVNVLHFIRDSEDPAGILAIFRDVMAAGSYLVLSQATTDGTPSDQVTDIEHTYQRATSPMVFRTREQIRRFFDGFDLVDPPGLVHPWQWFPDQKYGPQTDWMYGGVGKKTP